VVRLLRALEIGFVLVERNIFAIRAGLLLLQSFAAALVALIVDLWGYVSVGRQ
jgi:hypothetical protein